MITGIGAIWALCQAGDTQSGRQHRKHPRDTDVDVMRGIYEPAPLLRAIRAKCLDCSGGMESEIRQVHGDRVCLWPYRMAKSNQWTPAATLVGREPERVQGTALFRYGLGFIIATIATYVAPAERQVLLAGVTPERK
jgi:hypothetical protein